jgi:hypothetical protein
VLIPGPFQITHWLHPRLLLDQKRQQFEELQQAASKQAEVRYGDITTSQL